MRLSIRETPLGSLPEDLDPDTAVVSPDGRRLAFIETEAHPLAHLMPRGAEGLAEQLAPPLGERVVVDGVSGPRYDRVHAGSPRFSPDSKRIAYVARTGESWRVVLDGQEREQAEGFGYLLFSPDSKQLASLLRRGGRWHVEVDGRAFPEHEQVGAGSVLFSPDSRRLAYVALEGGKLFVVVDGVPGRKFAGILRGSLCFSPDSRHVAFSANSEDEQWIVVDDQDGPHYEELVDPTPLFGASGRLAYAATRGGRSFVVCDGVEGKGYDVIGPGSLTFSPDGLRLAYLAGIARGKATVVIDGQEGPTHSFVLKGSIRFSPDSRRLAYAVREGGLYHWLVAGQKELGREGLSVAPSGFQFSPDGRRVAYTALTEGEQRLIVDGAEHAGFELVGGSSPVFGPDGTHLAASVKVDGHWRIWMDGELADPLYDDILGTPVFSAADRFHVLHVREGEVLLVEVGIEA